jgi:hypothetical protein
MLQHGGKHLLILGENPNEKLLPSLVASNVLIHVAKEFHNEAMLPVTGCELMTNLATYNVFKDLVHTRSI